MKRREKKNKPELDTETTFADMNLEGFRWYDPGRKKRGERVKIGFKEYWLMVRSAFAAAWPAFLIVTLAFGGMVLIAYLWLM